MTNEMILYVISFVSLIFGVVLGKPFPGQHAVVATIQTDNGQTFNCVDFYKQPAFANSSLNLKGMPNLKELQKQNIPIDFGLKGRGCPLGTVPILNVGDSNIRGLHPLSVSNDNRCSAKVQTRANDPNKKFLGAAALIPVYKPSVDGSQWSSSRIKLLNGAESIEAGWLISPSEFKDSEAHLYASFSAGGKGCINLDCSGFTQVSADIPLGVAASQYTQKGSSQLTGWNVTIEKRNDDGHWWLSIIKDQKHDIGYWPKELFNSLANVANQVEFGGETFNPSGSDRIPGMGNGYFATYDTTNSACFVYATVVDESFNNIDPPDTEKFENCNLWYTVLDNGSKPDPTGRIIFYGGPLH